MTPSSIDEDLIEALSARSGLVCVVGAGGKKTMLYRLVEAHPGRIGITTTVYIPLFPEAMEACKVVAQEDQLMDAVTRAAATARVVAFATPSTKHGRLGGVPAALVGAIHRAAHFDVTLIKTDGARTRWIKAPEADEPQIPPDATTVIPVVSARAIGEPLTERVAHRLERIAAVTGAKPGEIITPEHIARLLSSDEGSLKGIGKAAVIPLINMVDDPAREALARAAAEQALTLSRRFSRVILASARRLNPLVAIVRRQEPVW